MSYDIYIYGIFDLVDLDYDIEIENWFKMNMRNSLPY